MWCPNNEVRLFFLLRDKTGLAEQSMHNNACTSLFFFFTNNFLTPKSVIQEYLSLFRHFTVSLQYFGFCPEESEENSLGVTLGSLRTLCTRSAKRTTLDFFHFLEALEDCKWRLNIFQRKIGIFQREIWGYLRLWNDNARKEIDRSASAIQNLVIKAFEDCVSAISHRWRNSIMSLKRNETIECATYFVM